jgi:hypothetical protein
MANQIVNGKYLINDTFPPFQSSGGLVHSCNNYYSLVQKAGSNKLEKDNIGITYETAFGGKAKKSKSSKSKLSKSKRTKSGLIKSKKSKKSSVSKSKKPKSKTIIKKTVNGIKKIKDMIMSKVSGMKKKKSKKSMKQKGGQESSGATPMNMRFFDPNAHLDNMSADSGMGVKSAYGLIDPKDVGSGMLAPYTTSTSVTANPSSGQQTGGKKSKAKKSKKGKSVMNKIMKKMSNIKKSILPGDKKKSKKSIKPKKDKSKKDKSVMDKIMKKMSNVKKSILPGDKKKKSKKSIKQKGGDELPGYDMNDKLAIYSGQKGGKDLMKKMSPSPIIKAQKMTVSIIDDAVNILNDFTKAYDKSVKDAENIKIGNQRLIQGGAKKSKKSKKSSASKKSKKSSASKKPKKSSASKKSSSSKGLKKLKGGDGSDFALTLASRGPSNAPDKFWGVDGETWFRQFNKTGQYIPNSRLAEAATPLLLSGKNDGIVMGYDDMGIASTYGKP